MSDGERVGLQAVFDLSQFTGNINIYNQQIAKTTQDTVASGSKMSGAFDSAKTAVVSFFTRAAEVAAGMTLAAVLNEVTQAIGAMGAGALEKEKTINDLNNVIRSTGGAAGLSSSDVQELANQYKNLFLGSDDAVIAVETLGMQMGVTADEMPGFIQNTANLATKMGGTEAAASALAFAMEQPTASLRRFRSAGVIFSDQQTALIKGYEEAGDNASAFAVIQDQVNTALGGAALSATTTMAGKWKTFSTTVSEAAEGIGFALLPVAHALFDATLAPAIPIIDNLSSSFANFITQAFSGDATAGFSQFRDAVNENLGGTAADALDWGANITSSLAQGIIDGIGYVIDALASVGSVIASWLMPGSPPKLLPDLDQWGTDAMGVYMSGWEQADFSTFNDISNTIAGYLKSIPIDAKDKAGQADVISSILGSREAVAAAINEVNQFGQVTGDSLQNIFAQLKVSSPELQAYIETMLNLQVVNDKVTAAQAELTAAQKDYDQAVQAAQSQVDSITNAESDLADQVEISRLKMVANDPSATALEKRRAELKIQEILAKQNQRNVIAEKKGVVDAAQTKLDAAKSEQALLMAQMQAQKAQLGMMEDQNKLISERAKLYEEANKAAAGGGGGGKAKPLGGGGIKAPGGGLADLLNAGDIAKKLGETWDKAITPLKAKWAALVTAWKPITDKIAEIWNGTVGPALKTFGDWVSQHSPEIMGFFGGLLATLAAGGIATQISLFVAGIMPALTALGVVLLGLLTPINLLALAVGVMTAAWIGNWGGIRDILTDFWVNTAQPALSQLWDWLQVQIPAALATLSAFWTGTLQPAITQVWSWVTGTLFPALSELWTWLSTTITAALTSLSTYWTGTLLPAITSVWSWMTGTLFPFFKELVDFLNAAFTLALTAIAGIWEKTVLPTITSVWNMFNDNVMPIIKTIAEYLDATFGPAFKTVGDYISGTFSDAVSGLVNGALAGLRDIWTGINQGIQDATKWLGEMAAKLSTIKLPDWMTPGSPTPWEMGLRGISAAMDDLSKSSLPTLTAKLDIQRPTTMMSTLAAPGVTRGGSVTNSSNVSNYNLSVQTRQSERSVMSNFYHMRAMGGA